MGFNSGFKGLTIKLKDICEVGLLCELFHVRHIVASFGCTAGLQGMKL